MPRVVGRRPALPSSRAIVGAFLVAASALGIYAAWAEATRGPDRSYVVARRTLPVGHVLTAADLDLVAVDLPEPLASGHAFTDPERLVGSTVLGPLRAGELIQAGAVVRRGDPTRRELSFALEPARGLHGRIAPGERIDVLATFGAGDDSYTVTVVRQALVVAVDGSRENLGDRRSLVLTVALDTGDEAMALAHALNAGEVFLVRASDEGEAADQTTDVYRAPRATPPAGA